MANVGFVVDGFNLYHSLKATEHKLGIPPVRWLDLLALCQTIVATSFAAGDRLQCVHYFSALAKHLESVNPDVVNRHRTYIRAIQNTGVQVTLANFKAKPRSLTLAECKVRLPWSRKKWHFNTRAVTLSYRMNEEKETDVAIACKALELLQTGSCDAIAIVTGDTDIAPAIRTARTLFPAATIASVFPYLRHNHALEKLSNKAVKLTGHIYVAHQLPNTIVLPSGRAISKPSNW